MAYKDPTFNHAHKPKDGIDPEIYASTSLPYKAAIRIANVLEDLHAEMQKPVSERFVDYPIEDYEEIDSFIRDNMVNLALSLETLTLSRKAAD